MLNNFWRIFGIKHIKSFTKRDLTGIKNMLSIDCWYEFEWTRQWGNVKTTGRFVFVKSNLASLNSIFPQKPIIRSHVVSMFAYANKLIFGTQSVTSTLIFSVLLIWNKSRSIQPKKIRWLHQILLVGMLYSNCRNIMCSYLI